MPYVLVEAGVVVAKDYARQRPGMIPAPAEVVPGWVWQDGVFSAPEPSPPPVPAEVSRLQFATALMAQGIITPAEAEAWAGGNAIPQLAADAIEGIELTDGQKAAARIQAIGATEISRDSALIAMLQAELSMSDADADALFAAAAALTE